MNELSDEETDLKRCNLSVKAMELINARDVLEASLWVSIPFFIGQWYLDSSSH